MKANWRKILVGTHSNGSHLTERGWERTFKKFPKCYLWAPLERKKIGSVAERYFREKEKSAFFFAMGLEVPQLIDFDDKNFVLIYEPIKNILSLRDVLSSEDISLVDKFIYSKEGLLQLSKMLELGESHGDSFTKNAYVRDRIRGFNQGKVGFCDFEDTRLVSDPGAYDIMIYSADVMHQLSKLHPCDSGDFLNIVESVYDGKKFGFSLGQPYEFLFSKWFGVDKKFFDFFKQ